MDNDTITTPIIGKDVIESLTTGMYEDCRFIYREYIQNSADQIDKAVQQGLLAKDDTNIFVRINNEEQFIEIEDNATGIAANQVAPILQNIAQSTKVRGVDKGFRGIGRLGGLGYCEKLIFETSFKGESIKSTMIWNARLLKEIINNRDVKESAVEVIEKVTSLNTTKEDPNEHYFKVRLEGITNERLLNGKEIHDYLAMVAPVPYDKSFIFKSKIYDKIKEEGISIDEYHIYVNQDLLTKKYNTIIYSDSKGQKERCDEIFDVIFFKEKTNTGDLLYWGWYGISEFNKVIENCNTARGIRLRKNNIQLGLENTLGKLHREPRGNFYFCGEVHALSKDLIPNARRDYLSENSTCIEFENKLKDFFYTQLYNHYREASKARSAKKDIQGYYDVIKEIEEKEKIGFNSKEEHKRIYEKKEQCEIKAKKADGVITKLKEKNADTPTEKIINKVTNNHASISTRSTSVANNLKPIAIETKPVYFTDKYTHLPKSERKLLSKIFEIINGVLPQELAQNLIAKIDDELTGKQ